MAKLTSRPCYAKRYSHPRVDSENATLAFAHSMHPGTHEPKAYFIGITNGEPGSRSFDLELTPEEWAHLISVWA